MPERGCVTHTNLESSLIKVGDILVKYSLFVLIVLKLPKIKLYVFNDVLGESFCGYRLTFNSLKEVRVSVKPSFCLSPRDRISQTRIEKESIRG